MLGLVTRLYFLFPDRLYLKLLYRLKLGRRLDLRHPKRFTEKLQWLKLYDRKPLYTKIVDKSEVKQYVARIIGEEYIIPTLGVWNRPEDIDWDSLPNRFILKTTHGGGGSGVVVCNDKAQFNKLEATKTLRKALKQNIYSALREWPYKSVPHRIIAEQLLEKDPKYNDVPDYKFYCFNGEPKVMIVATNRFSNHNFNYYDMEFNKLDIISIVGNKANVDFEKPSHFDEMKSVATKLCKGFPHIRVDLYYSNNRVYFGELTFYDASGFDNMSSDNIDLMWGSWMSLPIE